MRVVMVDGNFTAIHQDQPNAIDDVHLTAGEFFMVESNRYKAHLSVAQDSKQVGQIITKSFDTRLILDRIPLVMNILQ